MVHLFTSVARISLLLSFAVYTFLCFHAIRRSRENATFLYRIQFFFILLILYNGYLVLFLNTGDLRLLFLCLAETVYFLICSFVYKKLYKEVSMTLVNNMCVLLCIGFIILARLNVDSAMRQFVLAVVALLITCSVPFFIHRMKFWYRLTWVYAVVGIVGLLSVRVLGVTEYGARLSINVGGISLQPAEIIKVIFVFFVASRFFASTEFKELVKTTIVAAMHVLIMVSSRDLGGAVIYFLTYLIMLYVATKKIRYFGIGIMATALFSVVGYFLFSHVRTRVIAWRSPLEEIDGAGYQISQSLFAIGSGGWFGSGLTEGMPETIPVVTEDFVFSAISEEMGGLFALCLIFVCISVFIMFMNIAMQIHDRFYKYVALGLGSVYGVQVFVTLGGVTNFIPSTGITLPLISYGGSSLLSTMLIFAIIQGLYVYRTEEIHEEK